MLLSAALGGAVQRATRQCTAITLSAEPQETMMLTELFRSGDSQAVRIPKELAFPADWNEVSVERQGDALVVRPVRRRTLVGIAQKFAAFPANFMAEGREPEGETERTGQ